MTEKGVDLLTLGQLRAASLKIYESRAEDLAAAVMDILGESKRVSKGQIYEAIVSVASDRFRRFSEE